MIIILKSLWNYKGFIFGLVKRDFQSKYLNSVFGSIWSILNPLAMIVVYTIIFSQIMGSRMPNSSDTLSYSIYLCAGLLPWQFFSETIMRLQNVFIDQSGIMKKVSFPRSSLPFYILLSSSINFMIVFSLYLIFLIIIGAFPGFVIIGIIPLLIVQQLFALGIGIIVGTLNVFFRDVGYSVGIIIQFWTWLTPIVYVLDIIPDKFRSIFNLNIMLPVINGYQNIFLNKQWPDLTSLWPILCLTLLLLISGYKIFKKLDKEMVDEL